VDWSPTHYARSGDLHVAYQVLGDGELDLLILPYGLNISRVVTDLVGGSGLSFSPCGDHELKGVPGSWPLSPPTSERSSHHSATIDPQPVGIVGSWWMASRKWAIHTSLMEARYGESASTRVSSTTSDPLR
jgi:hypothetical protein